MNSSNEYNFLKDLVLLLRDHATQVKQSTLANMEFEKGRLLAYYEVLSLIQQQAKAFGVDMAEINMEDFDPDKDIL